MHSHYRPLRLNVGFLLSQTAGYGRAFDFREDRLNLGSDLTIQNFSGHLILHRTPQGIVGKGSFHAQLPAECARCLTEFTSEIDAVWEDLFVYPPQNATDPLLAVGEDGHIDLEPILREYLFVNKPTRALCREDCKGLCPVCGNNRNDEPCSHPETSESESLPLEGRTLRAIRKEKHS